MRIISFFKAYVFGMLFNVHALFELVPQSLQDLHMFCGITVYFCYKANFGGVTMMNTDHIQLINGFSNQYWGWGGEDDDLLLRVR